MSGFDLCDPDRGIFASAHSGRVAAVFDHEAALAAGPADGALGEELRTLNMGPVSLSVEMAEMGPALSLGGAIVPAEELTPCLARGTLRGSGDPVEIESVAVSITGDPAPAPGLRRSIVVSIAGGGLLALGAARPPGADEHGDEEVVAALALPGDDGPGEQHADPPDPAGPDPDQADPGDPEPGGAATDPAQAVRSPAIEEVLLSTEFDPEGRQRRATIEMWPGPEHGEAAIRAGGTIVCGTRVELDEARVDLAFFRWSVAGHPGLGRYEIVTPR